MLRRVVASSLALVLVVALATPGAVSFWCRVMGKTMATCCCASPDDEPPASGPTVANSCCERTVTTPALPATESSASADLARLSAPAHALPTQVPTVVADVHGSEAIATRALEPRPPPPPLRAQLATWII